MEPETNSSEHDLERIGRRIRERRLQLGLSTQELADKAGVARYTIVRIEAGKPFKPATLEAIRSVLNLFNDYLTRDDPPFDFCVQDKPAERHWTVAVKKERYQKHGDIPDPTHEDDPQERQRLGHLGFQPFFTSVLKSELPNGMLNQGLMEIYRETWVDAHPGEEFVYCLRGSARILVRGEEFLLAEGGAITFKGSEPHQYAPASPLGPGDPPLLLLIVVALQKGDYTRDVRGRARPRPPARAARSRIGPGDGGEPRQDSHLPAEKRRS